MPCLLCSWRPCPCRHNSVRARQQVSLQAKPVAEVQHLVIHPNVTSGTYQLRYNHSEHGQLVSDLSAAIAWNVTPLAAVQQLPGLSSAGLSISQVRLQNVPSQCLADE